MFFSVNYSAKESTRRGFFMGGGATGGMVAILATILDFIKN